MFHAVAVPASVPVSDLAFATASPAYSVAEDTPAMLCDALAAPEGPGAPTVGMLGRAAVAPADAELVACLHMRQGIIVGAFVLDLPRIRARLVATATDAVRDSGLSMQDVARRSVLATGALVAQSAGAAQSLAKQAAWSAGEACVVGAWQLGTWPMRLAYRAVAGSGPAT